MSDNLVLTERVDKENNMQILNISNMTAEEIWANNKIESLASSISIEKLENLRDTIRTLSAMVVYANRKDALFLLCGYYTLELKDYSEKNIFIGYINGQYNYEFIEFIMKDVAKNKNLYRYKSIVDSVLSGIRRIVNDLSQKEKENLISLVKNALWGVRLKKKFLDEFIEEDLEEDEFNYWIGD